MLTIAEVAKDLRVSRRTIKRWIKAGKLKAVQLSPNIVRIETQELDQFKKGNDTN